MLNFLSQIYFNVFSCAIKGWIPTLAASLWTSSFVTLSGFADKATNLGTSLTVTVLAEIVCPVVGLTAVFSTCVFF